MMKKFETPEIKLLTFAVEDIVTTSNMLPWIPMSEDGGDKGYYAE